METPLVSYSISSINTLLNTGCILMADLAYINPKMLSRAQERAEVSVEELSGITGAASEKI